MVLRWKGFLSGDATIGSDSPTKVACGGHAGRHDLAIGSDLVASKTSALVPQSSRAAIMAHHDRSQAIQSWRAPCFCANLFPVPEYGLRGTEYAGNTGGIECRLRTKGDQLPFGKNHGSILNELFVFNQQYFRVELFLFFFIIQA